MAYKLCDCKNKEIKTEEQLLTYNMLTNKKYFFRNYNNNIKTLNSTIRNANTKDTLEINYAANIIIRNYKKYREKKAKKKIDTKIKYDRNIKKDSTKQNNINNSNKMIIDGIDKENEHNYSSYLSNNSNLKKMKNLQNSNLIYLGDKADNGQKNGFGITIWNNNSKYIGFYRNNKAEGYGKFIDGNDEYKGEFKEDCASGFGIYTHGDEVIYTGYWNDDLEDNYGIEKWKDGSKYIGQFSGGKKHGIGTYFWNDGSRYEGNWNNNVIDGYGIRYYNKGKVYIGQWKNNLKDGFGELIFVGRKYIGFYSNDKKEGFGMCYWEKKNKAFVGFWKNGKQIGFGKFMTEHKRKYGNWINEYQVNWYKNEEEAFENLENKGLQSYKSIFMLSLDDIRNYSINNDEFNDLLNQV